jgi:hypothetical protein
MSVSIVKDTSELLKWGAIAGGIVLIGYGAYKLSKFEFPSFEFPDIGGEIKKGFENIKKTIKEESIFTEEGREKYLSKKENLEFLKSLSLLEDNILAYEQLKEREKALTDIKVDIKKKSEQEPTALVEPVIKTVVTAGGVPAVGVKKAVSSEEFKKEFEKALQEGAEKAILMEKGKKTAETFPEAFKVSPLEIKKKDERTKMEVMYYIQF